MNPRQLLLEKAHRLLFVVDSEHPQDVRATIEEWIKPLRGAQTSDWLKTVTPGVIPIWLPSPTRLHKTKRPSGACIFIRPLHQDLLTMVEPGETESLVDAVVEAREGEGPFHDVVAGFLARALAREGEASRKVALRFQRSFEKSVRQALKEMASDPETIQSYLGIFGTFLELQEDLAGVPGEETLSQNLELLSKKLDRKKNWRLIFSANAHEETEGNLFYLGRMRSTEVFLEQKTSEIDPLKICSAALIATSLGRQVRNWEAEDSEVKPGHIVQEAFQALPFPLLLLGEKNEVLQHNTAFVKMNLPPSRVVKLEELDQIQSKDQNWTVRKTVLTGATGPRTLLTFLPEKPRGMTGNGPTGGQDLGIITSSIAHELNNPIGGLLAALELLSMDDHWDDEAVGQLAEMKQGAQRCKQLVETFLGFSRMKTDNVSMEKDLLKRCFEQALHLQRFRMVESGLRVTLAHKQQHPFAYPLHAPTATMLAYLVIGELMTGFHHLKLLERRSARGLVLEVSVTEDADRFRIEVNPSAPTKQGLSSKLLQFLMQQEKLQLDASDEGKLLFTHQNVLI